MSDRIARPGVFVAMSASPISHTACLIATPTRVGVPKTIVEVSLVGMPFAPEDGVGEAELEKVLWAVATAAGAALEGHLPRLQAIVERRKAAEVGYRR